MGTESARPPRYDFHAHTYLTDGTTSATDMWYAADALGHRLLAITDHVGTEDPVPLLRHLSQERAGWEQEGMATLIGVEITKAPPHRIAEIARAARKAGAEIVIVHGETIAEIVPPGTNRAALASGEVDVLAHPGLLTVEDAELARANGTILELSARKAHCITNGRVARVAIEVGLELVVDSDAHGPDQLVSHAVAQKIALGAGLDEARVRKAIETTPEQLLARIRSR